MNFTLEQTRRSSHSKWKMATDFQNIREKAFKNVVSKETRFSYAISSSFHSLTPSWWTLKRRFLQSNIRFRKQQKISSEDEQTSPSW